MNCHPVGECPGRLFLLKILSTQWCQTLPSGSKLFSLMTAQFLISSWFRQGYLSPTSDQVLRHEDFLDSVIFWNTFYGEIARLCIACTYFLHIGLVSHISQISFFVVNLPSQVGYIAYFTAMVCRLVYSPGGSPPKPPTPFTSCP